MYCVSCSTNYSEHGEEILSRFPSLSLSFSPESLLSTGDGIETMGEVTTTKVRNGMSFTLSVIFIIIIMNIRFLP